MPLSPPFLFLPTPLPHYLADLSAVFSPYGLTPSVLAAFGLAAGALCLSAVRTAFALCAPLAALLALHSCLGEGGLALYGCLTACAGRSLVEAEMG